MTALLRRAAALLSWRFVLLQFALALSVFLLFVLWLKVPEASGFDLIFSAALAIVIVALASGGEAALLLGLAWRPLHRGRVVKGALYLLLAALLCLAWSALVDHLSENDIQLASYLNSHFPARLRHVFSYPHVLLWLGWSWSALRWAGIAKLLTLALAGAQRGRPLRGLRPLLTLRYWLLLAAAFIVANVVNGGLLSWVPGRGVAVEAVSLVLRLGFVLIVDLLLACFLLASATVLLAGQETPDGTPETSQPRTVEDP